MTRCYLALTSTLIALSLTANAHADFRLRIDSADFGIASVYNTLTSFEFEFLIAEPLVAGRAYTNPALTGVNYRVNGSLPQPTPSGFPAFALVRTIAGEGFYTLSPEASLSFTVAPNADLSDGLQLDELAGAGVILSLNAREFNQQPGRYHPPLLTLNANGTGSMANSNNQSTFPNPPPPLGSGMLVDVTVGEEYDVALSFVPASVAVAAAPASADVPVPPAMVVVAAGLVATIGHQRSRRALGRDAAV